MTAIVATTVAVRSDVNLGNHPSTGESASPSSHGAPRYFVALAHTGQARTQIRTADAVVANTATGRIIARVAVPKPYNAFVAVSGAEDDRTFVLAAQELTAQSARSQLNTGSATRFYQLRISTAGQPRAVLTALPLPVLPAGNFSEFGSIALSPDGTRLAVQLFAAEYRSPYGVRVYDVANGSYRTWILAHDDASASPSINSPSWVAGGKFLAILVYSNKPRGCTAGCVQLLDTTTSGGNVMAASRTIFRTAKLHRLVSWSTVLVTPDGSQTLIAGMAGKKLRSGIEEFYLPVVYDFSTPSGDVRWHFAGQSGQNLYPLWTSAKARFFVLTRPNADRIGSVSAAIYGPHGIFQVKLPAQTLNVAW